MSFTARRNGVCSKCNGDIKKDVDQIGWSRKTGLAFHSQCGEPSTVSTGTVQTALKESGGEIEEAIKKLVSSIQTPAAASAVDMESVAALIDERLAGIVAPRVIHIENGTAPIVKLDRTHYQFETLLKLAGIRDHHGNRMNFYLYGESGSGKSHGGDQLAQALGLGYDFASLEPQAPLSLIRGFMSATGLYIPSGFFLKYTQGGVFCFDELDNSSSTFQTCLNSALSNGHFSFPHGKFDRHPDFICIATGNTIGLGPTVRYPSRRAMDPATRDRFKFLQWEADQDLTRSIVSGIIGPDKAQDLIDWVDAEGSALVTAHPTCFVTPRSYIDSALLEVQGMRRDQIIDMAIRRGVK